MIVTMKTEENNGKEGFPHGNPSSLALEDARRSC
jgi:hypothetical protein